MKRFACTLLALAGGLAHAQTPQPVQMDIEGAYTSEAAGIVRPRLGVNPSSLGSIMAKHYPLESILKREVGETTIAMCITDAGKIVNPFVQKSSGSQRLDDASQSFLRSVPISPATLDGKTVPYCGYTFAVAWSLPPPGPSPSPAGAPPPPALIFPKLLEIDGAHSLGEPGVERPKLGIPSDVLAELMRNFYPKQSLKAREEGETTLIMCVSDKGKVLNTAVFRSSGFERLDNATKTLMATVPMKPALLKGEPVLFCNYPVSVVWLMPRDMPPAEDDDVE